MVQKDQNQKGYQRQHWEVISAQERKGTDWPWRGEPEFMFANKQMCLEAESIGVTELRLRR